MSTFLNYLYTLTYHPFVYYTSLKCWKCLFLFLMHILTQCVDITSHFLWCLANSWSFFIFICDLSRLRGTILQMKKMNLRVIKTCKFWFRVIIKHIMIMKNNTQQYQEWWCVFVVPATGLKHWDCSSVFHCFLPIMYLYSNVRGWHVLKQHL